MKKKLHEAKRRQQQTIFITYRGNFYSSVFISVFVTWHLFGKFDYYTFLVMCFVNTLKIKPFLNEIKIINELNITYQPHK